MASVGLSPFTPGNTVAITITSSSAATAIQTGTGDQVMVSSLAGNAIAFVAFGISSTTVTIPTTATNGTPILPGTVQIFTVPPGTTHIAVIGTSGTLYVTRGDGE